MKNSEIAEGAVECIERHGWRTGQWGDVESGYCLMGAGISALTGAKNLDPQFWHDHIAHTLSGRPSAATVVSTAIAPGIDLYPDLDVYWGNTIASHNDSVLANKDEAIEVLTKAAKYWRDRGE